MRRNLRLAALVACVFLPPFLRADCTNDQDHRSNFSANRSLLPPISGGAGASCMGLPECHG